MLETIYWILIILMFVVGFIGLIYPIIPSVLFIIGGILLYGLLFTFDHFGWFFWLVQGMFVLLLFLADYVANMIGVKKYGGSRAGVWGSTIGILVGPFLIPVVGIIVGPFIGAIVAELLVHRKSLKEAFTIGFGSVIGFISGAAAKFIVQTFMIIYFLFKVL